MKFELQNPLPLISINAVGIGIDLTYGTALRNPSATESAPRYDHLLTCTVNFIVGRYMKSWTVKSG